MHPQHYQHRSWHCREQPLQLEQHCLRESASLAASGTHPSPSRRRRLPSPQKVQQRRQQQQIGNKSQQQASPLTSLLQLPHANDPRVHEQLVDMMERRLSNVQLLMRSSRSNSESSGTPEHRPSYPYEPVAPLQRSPGYRDSGAPWQRQYQQSGVNFTGLHQQPHRQPCQQRQQQQAKWRRMTLWETLTGLVCSLGALASRAAKMATKKAEPL